MFDKTQIIILAAGKRMKSDSPKVLMEANGKAMIKHLLDNSICEIETKNAPIIVVGYKSEMVKDALGLEYNYVLQEEQLGTGHAVMVTKSDIPEYIENVIILFGDMPLVSVKTLKSLIEKQDKNEGPLTMGTIVVPDFDDWRSCYKGFSRVIRDENNKMERTIEVRDANSEHLEIKEVNPGYFCVDKKWLFEELSKLKNNNAQEEYYLTDIIGKVVEQGFDIQLVDIDPVEGLGANTPEQLVLLEKMMK